MNTNNQNLLFLTNMEGMWPFSYQLKSLFMESGFRVTIFDIGHKKFIDEEVSTIKIPKYFNLLLKIRFLRIIFRRYEYMFYKKFFNKLKSKNYITIIFYHSQIYNYLINEINSVSSKIVIIYAGSDFYRVNKKEKLNNKNLLDLADKNIFTNSGMRKDLTSFYNGYYNKSRVAYIGSKVLDTISTNRITKENVKSKFGIDNDTVVITIGYSGSTAQQHQKIIEYILPYLNKKKITFIFPMTYGLADSNYISQIKSQLDKNEFDSLFFRDMLSEMEIAEIRYLSDITINMQITDQASASLVEYLGAGNLLIIGDWLNYEFWDQLNLFYIKANFKNLGVLLQKNIEDFQVYKAKLDSNRESIIKNLSWSNCKQKFLEEVLL